MQRDVLSETLVDVGIDRLSLARRANAPSRVHLGSTDLASGAAGDSIRLVNERVLVPCFDVENLLLESADDALELGEKRLLIDIVCVHGPAWRNARDEKLDEQQTRFSRQ